MLRQSCKIIQNQKNRLKHSNLTHSSTKCNNKSEMSLVGIIKFSYSTEKRTHPCTNRLAILAPIVPTPSSFSSEYVDAHSIRLQIPPHPAAFAYIFEYATVSTKPDEWYFAGATTMPIVTFTILDPCRDYKFRTIVVMRSSNPLDHFVIYSDRSIPVQLPPFVLSPDQISAEAPIFNATTESLRIYVRWTLPRGYSDSDIYGYEAPALYPLQCRTPEDELPQPKIEIVRAGGRLAVSLPSYVLEARCRLWVEVRMLPRCVRLEPFSIQKNIEIDCDRNPELDICTKGKQCSHVVRKYTVFV
ncbi:unnamed protein product [Nippostrongylus brasiliensis]|uniref:Fibronectin type-III domain-containing protein n=1 Tax=Nippostrongylus brasiliensis TaxID=27835 RepID=A0A0N4XCB1_NIPBR|nr:unnamed protein product [Nippostrongylus brasiliensis]